MRRLFTVAEYHRMAEAGILDPDDRVELLGGEIIKMTPIGVGHAGCVNGLTRWLFKQLADRVTVAVQNPVVLDDFWEPQPDISVCRPREDNYSTAHPRPVDIYLLIEVTDTSQRRDRELKIPRYGRAGVLETWLVDLESERIEVYREPESDGYSSIETMTSGDTLSPAAFPDVSITVDEIIP